MRGSSEAPGPRASREAAWILAGRFAFGVAGIVGLKIQTAVMDPDLFGRFSLAFGAVALVSGFLVSPLGHTQNHFLAEAVRQRSAASLLRSVLRWTNLLAVAGIAAGVPVALGVWGAQTETGWILVAGSVALLAGNFRDRQQGAFNTYRWRGRYAILAATDAWLRPLLIAAAVVTLGASVGSAMTGVAVGAVLVALAGWPWWRALFREFAAAGEPTTFEPLRLWKYSGPYFGIFLLTWISSISDRYVVSYFAGAAEAGRYVAGYQVGAAVPMLLASAFFPIFSPIILQAAAVRGRPVPLDAVLLLFATLGLLLGGMVVVEPDSLGRVLLSRSEFLSGDEIVPWVLAGIMLLGLQQVVEHQAYVTRRSLGLLAVGGTVAVFNLTLNLIMVPLFGSRAAAWSTAATYALNLVATVFVYRPSIAVVSWMRIAGLTGWAIVLVVASRAIPVREAVSWGLLAREGTFVVAFATVAAVIAGDTIRKGYREIPRSQTPTQGGPGAP
jgi:O-antigen/teichoic acid export membrane protein